MTEITKDNLVKTDKNITINDEFDDFITSNSDFLEALKHILDAIENKNNINIE